MAKKTNQCGWMYLFYPEDSTGAPRNHTVSRQLGLCKVALWTGVSMLISIGISQLI